jgi:hypothetical protein
MGLLKRAALLVLVISCGPLIPQSRGQDIKLTFHSNAASNSTTWSVRIVESHLVAGQETDYGVAGADVEALQNERIVASGRCDPNGFVTFNQLSPANGDVKVRAKRSASNSWEETLSLSWRVPDASIRLATDPTSDIKWQSCALCPSPAETRQRVTVCYAPAECAPCPRPCQPTCYVVQQCSAAYVQCPTVVTYYYPAW